MNEGTLVIKRTLQAPVDKVFTAWTDPETVAKWYGPVGTKNEIHEMDVREGGAYRLTMHTPDGGEHPLRGEFKTIEKPDKLVFTWQWETPDNSAPETLVTVELKDAGEGKTEMTLTHELPNAEVAEQHKEGWESSFEDLEKVLA